MNLVASAGTNLDVFHAFGASEPQHLEEVYERLEDGCKITLILKFQEKCLIFSAEPDDDTISVEDSNSIDVSVYRRIDSSELWRPLIGKQFGWGWITVNQQGYCDGVMLSFEGIRPRILLSVAASSLHTFQIVEGRN